MEKKKLGNWKWSHFQSLSPNQLCSLELRKPGQTEDSRDWQMGCLKDPLSQAGSLDSAFTPCCHVWDFAFPYTSSGQWEEYLTCRATVRWSESMHVNAPNLAPVSLCFCFLRSLAQIHSHRSHSGSSSSSIGSKAMLLTWIPELSLENQNPFYSFLCHCLQLWYMFL